MMTMTIIIIITVDLSRIRNGGGGGQMGFCVPVAVTYKIYNNICTPVEAAFAV